tara:strand:- start:600 stop:758 length:159 start_codon:yes stop_codon:yes gene_type:complete
MSNLDFREQQAFLLKKVEKIRPLLVSVLPAEILSRFCHTILDLRKQQAILPD